MAAFMEDGEFELSIRDVFGHRDDSLETGDRFVGPKNHAVALAGQMQQLWIVCGELHEAIEHRLSAVDLEARAESAAGIDEGDEVLGILADRQFEQVDGFVKTVELPEGAGALELGNVNAEAGDVGRLRA